MSEDVPLLSVPPLPNCPRCGRPHHTIPMTLEDVADVLADELRATVEDRIFAIMQEKMR